MFETITEALKLLPKRKAAGQKAVPEDLRPPPIASNLVAQLPWGEPDDGVVFLRGGERVWYGVELTCPTGIQVSENYGRAMSEAIRVMLNQAVEMGEGGRLIVESLPAQEDMIRHFLQNQGKSEDRLIAEMERREQKDLYDARRRGEITATRYFLTCYVNVPKRHKSSPLNYDEYRAQMTLVRQRRTNMLNRLEALGLQPAVMSNAEVKRLMWRYLNGNLATAKPPMFTGKLDLRDIDPDRLRTDRTVSANTTRYQVAETEIGTQNPGFLTMGDRLVGAISIEKRPSSSQARMLDQIILGLVGEHYYIMVDFEHLRQGETRAKLDTAINELDGARDNSVLQAGASTAAKSLKAHEAMSNAEYRGHHFWQVGITTVYYAHDRQHLRELNERIRGLYSLMAGAHAFVSNEQLKKTFFDVMPFSAGLTRHRIGCQCMNLADLFPKTSAWLGTASPIMPLRNRHGSMTGINFQQGGTNFGVMVLGQSGGGKSVWNMNMLLTHVPLGYLAFVMDPKHDYDEAIYSLGGQVITIAPDAKLPDGRPVRINVFDPTPGELMPSASKVSYIIAILRVLEVVNTPEEKVIAEAALQQYFILQSRRTVVPGEEEPQNVYIGGRLRGFVEALSSLQRIGSEDLKSKPVFAQAKARMVGLLQSYVQGNGGILADFLDGETTVEITSKCVSFDVEIMLQTSDPVLRSLSVLIVGEFIFQQAARNPGGKIGIFEELGVLAGIPELAALVNRWFKTGRSMGMIPVGTSQEPRDFEKLGGLINNSAWIVMTQLGESEMKALQASAGLPEHMLALASTLRLQKGVYGEYLVMQKVTDGVHIGDVTQLWMTPEKLWTVTTDKAEKDIRAHATAQMGSRSEAILELASKTRARRAS